MSEQVEIRSVAAWFAAPQSPGIGSSTPLVDRAAVAEAFSAMVDMRVRSVAESTFVQAILARGLVVGRCCISFFTSVQELSDLNLPSFVRCFTDGSSAGVAEFSEVTWVVVLEAISVAAAEPGENEKSVNSMVGTAMAEMNLRLN